MSSPTEVAWASSVSGGLQTSMGADTIGAAVSVASAPSGLHERTEEQVELQLGVGAGLQTVWHCEAVIVVHGLMPPTPPGPPGEILRGVQVDRHHRAGRLSMVRRGGMARRRRDGIYHRSRWCRWVRGFRM